jgi:hypothetical protein
VEEKRGPKGGRKIKGQLERVIKRLKTQGLSNEAIGQRLGLSATGVRKALLRIGFKPEGKTRQLALQESGSPSVPPVENEEGRKALDVPDERAPEEVSIGEQLEVVEGASDSQKTSEEESPRGFEISMDVDPRDCWMMRFRCFVRTRRFPLPGFYWPYRP